MSWRPPPGTSISSVIIIRMSGFFRRFAVWRSPGPSRGRLPISTEEKNPLTSSSNRMGENAWNLVPTIGLRGFPRGNIGFTP